MSIPFKRNDVVRYLPADRFDRWWCREGTALVREREDGSVYLTDTFWGVRGSEPHILTDDERATAELVFNLGDYTMLDEYGSGSRDAWLTYAPADREVVTSQHRLQARYYVRIGSQPDLETMITNAHEALADAEREAESAARRVESRSRELAELQEQAAALTEVTA